MNQTDIINVVAGSACPACSAFVPQGLPHRCPMEKAANKVGGEVPARAEETRAILPRPAPDYWTLCPTCNLVRAYCGCVK